MISKGARVTLAGSFVNFSLGLFYAWSVFAAGLISEFGWTKAQAAFPYTLELLVFSVCMVFGGRFQDKVGPRKGATLSGIFTGAALIFCALFPTPLGISLSFGVLFGAAAAFGYSAVTPAAVKWFPPEKRGLVTGVVLMSLGAAALVWAPLLNLLIVNIGLIRTFWVCGFFLFVAITLSAQLLAVPVEGDTFSNGPREASAAAPSGWRETIRHPAFILLWIIMGLSIGAGLMIIGHLVQLAELNYHISWGYLLVSAFALSNTLGRFFGGLLCDRVGYLRIMQGAIIVLAAAMLIFLSGWGWPALAAATVLIGLSYGVLYSCFPTAVAYLFGMDNFGVNYGMLFSAVGLAGGLAPLAAAALADRSGSYNPAFMLGLAAATACLLLSRVLPAKCASHPSAAALSSHLPLKR